MHSRPAVLLACLLASGPVLADGKMYVREDVPVSEPYQRALIAWEGGRQLLVVQPKLLGAAKDFAWVLPVPAPPEIGALEAEVAGQLFANLDRDTAPHVERLRVTALLVILIAGGVLLARYGRRIPARIGGFPRVVVFAAVGVFAIIATGFLVPTLSRGRGTGGLVVEVLAVAQAGIYDVEVVRSTRPGALKEWLATNGYLHGQDDERVLADYEARGWCFACSRIRGKESRAGADGMIDALVLSFPAAEPIYPFALTATQEAPTEVLLYVFADGRVEHPRLATRFAGTLPLEKVRPRAWQRSWRDFPRSSPEGAGAEKSPEREIPDLAGNPSSLTKLKGRLSGADTAGDLTFAKVPMGGGYRATAYRW